MEVCRNVANRPEPARSAQECRYVVDALTAPTFARDPEAEGMRRHLATVVEAEILPRLMLAHRGEARPRPASDGGRPAADEAQRLCDLLLARGDAELAPHLLRFLDRGLTLESVLVELLTPAARHLGRLWEEDACDFVEVTVALGRLQAAARDLCARYGDGADGPPARSILLMPSPGETHVFCLSIVSAIFREAGWDVTTAGHDPSVDPADMVGAEWFDVVGLTLACDVFQPALPEAIRALRAASRNPDLRIVVGGPYFARNPDQVRRVGADATVEDARLAPMIAESLLEIRRASC